MAFLSNRTGVQNSYKHNVRIANWSEDQELSELRLKDFLHRKETGQLLIHGVQKHLSKSLQEVELTYTPDGFLRFGDSVMLYSSETEGVLSVDMAETIKGASNAFAVTTSTLTQSHVARNCFILEPYANNVKMGDVLQLGQQFRLRMHSALSPNPGMYLHSQPVSSTSFSKVSRKQEVCMRQTKTFDTVWTCAFKDGKFRFEMEGEPVPANAELLLIHCSTGHALGSSKLAHYNDFGMEYEVCAHLNNKVNKKQGLYAELQGKATADAPSRREECSNHWAFLTAAAPSSGNGCPAPAPSSTTAAQGMGGGCTSNQVLAKVRSLVLDGGVNVLHTLYANLQSGQDVITFQHFYDALQSVGVLLNQMEMDVLCDAFATNTSPQFFDHQAFLLNLRGVPNQRRTNLITRAFAKLQLKNGTIPVSTLVQVYDPARHPQVMSGALSTQEVRSRLLAMLATYAKGEHISLAGFQDYYLNVGVYVDSDDVFSVMMCNAWGLRE